MLAEGCAVKVLKTNKPPKTGYGLWEEERDVCLDEREVSTERVTFVEILFMCKYRLQFVVDRIFSCGYNIIPVVSNSVII